MTNEVGNGQIMVDSSKHWGDNIQHLRIRAGEALLKVPPSINKVATDYISAIENKLVNISKQLEDMTPGGSEFNDNPDKCLKWIKDRLASTAELAQRAKKAEEMADIYKSDRYDFGQVGERLIVENTKLKELLTQAKAERVEAVDIYDLYEQVSNMLSDTKQDTTFATVSSIFEFLRKNNCIREAGK